MRREPSLTFGGALTILGHHDRPVIDKLDKILGGVILASGVAVAVATGLGLTLAPLALWAAIWGWTEQKDAAIGLLRNALDSATGKLDRTSGHERRQLIAAAHTVIVVAAFFEALRDEIGGDGHHKLKISEERKVQLLTGRAQSPGVSLVDLLYLAEVPMPSPSRGFEENISFLNAWMDRYASQFQDFLGRVVDPEDLRVSWARTLSTASERYRSHFLKLSADVPEFAIWAMLDEHAATRELVREQNSKLAAAIDRNVAAMARVEALLALTAGSAGAVPDLRGRVDRLNQTILDQPIIPTTDKRHGPAMTFPSVSRMYINPRFRIATSGRDSKVADARWWHDLRSRDEFDLMLSAYVVMPNATRLPMLLLGDPGAGKSLLTRVLAARLGAASYTVVHVPLRRVGASAPIGHQIQQALDELTTDRVKWADLSDQSVGTTRVVLLDGLDELLQASSSDRSGYLQEVADFQDAEAALERPLVVIVTSRIVVADRVYIPDATVVVKLDTFTDEDIADWLRRWQDGYAMAIASGRMRELTLEAALRQRELARQPLLLLMLAIYAADPELPPLGEEMSTADLYQSILEEFARREARKTLGDYASGHELDGRARDHLDRLAIAALAMFNRGRQDISEDELGLDLKALDERLMERSRPDEAGQRVIGEFFFVHAPEAHLTTRDRRPRRNYEFLHATFGEYLVASRVMAELREAAAKSFAGHRGPSAPEDGLLFALLSHQPLAARQTTLAFAEQIAAALPEAERARLLDTLEMLLETYRDRRDWDTYAGYQPTPHDTICRLACYTANLVSLRVTLAPGNASVPLAALLRVPDGGGLPQWRTLVMLWESGLDTSGMQAMLTTLDFVPDPPGLRAVRAREWPGDEGALVAQLTGDRDAEWRTKYGTPFWDGEISVFFDSSRDWVHEMSLILVPLAAGVKLRYIMVGDRPRRLDARDVQHIATLLFNYLRVAGPEENVAGMIKELFRLPKVFEIDGYALARIVVLQPKLLDEVARLRDPGIYGEFYGLIQATGSDELRRRMRKKAAKAQPGDLDARALLDRVVRESGRRQWSMYKWNRE